MFRRSTNLQMTTHTMRYSKGLNVDEKLSPQTEKEKQLWNVIDEKAVAEVFDYPESAEAVLLEGGLDVDLNAIKQSDLAEKMWEYLEQADIGIEAKDEPDFTQIAKDTGYAEEIKKEAMILALSGIDVERNEWLISLSEEVDDS